MGKVLEDMAMYYCGEKYWKKIAQMKLFCVYMQMQLMKLYENSSSLYERVGNYISRQSRKRASRLFVHLTVLKELPRVLFRGLENPRYVSVRLVKF